MNTKQDVSLMKKPESQYVVSNRGGIIESRHEVHAAVVDAAGNLLYSVGNPNRLTLIRSAAKPAQALAVVETGALEKYGFDEADLALMCASHNSEDRHVDRAKKMLASAGHVESNLRCGGHPSILPKLNQKWIKEDFKPTEVYNNCSGKHSGMLAGAKAIGANIENYHHFDHPIQRRVQSVVEEISRLKPGEVQWGVDGCNMATPAMPLSGLGTLFLSFAKAADDAAAGKDLSSREKGLARVFSAMSTYPEMVAGEERFCTLLMQAFGSSLIGKVGADACYGIGLRECESTKRLGVSGPIGIAVKMEDGNMNVLYMAMAEILEQLDIGTPEERQKLDQFHKHKIINSWGAVTGNYEYHFKLKKVENES